MAAGRLDTHYGTGPRPKIWQAMARNRSQSLSGDRANVQQTAKGAGNFGQREARFASVPVMLRIRRAAPVNGPGARTASIPIGNTRRKKGYPPITTLPTAG